MRSHLRARPNKEGSDSIMDEHPGGLWFDSGSARGSYGSHGGWVGSGNRGDARGGGDTPEGFCGVVKVSGAVVDRQVGSRDVLRERYRNHLASTFASSIYAQSCVVNFEGWAGDAEADPTSGS